MMISKKFLPAFEDLLGELSALGYQHTYGIMNAADYGVAQSRRRCFCISKLGGVPPALPAPMPLGKCLADYLEPEPVAEHYYLSKERLEGLIWSNEKEAEHGNGFRFEPTDGGGTAHTITRNAGGRKTDNFLRLRRRDRERGDTRTRERYGGRTGRSRHCPLTWRKMRNTLSVSGRHGPQGIRTGIPPAGLWGPRNRSDHPDMQRGGGLSR